MTGPWQLLRREASKLREMDDELLDLVAYPTRDGQRKRAPPSGCGRSFRHREKGWSVVVRACFLLIFRFLSIVTSKPPVQVALLDKIVESVR